MNARRRRLLALAALCTLGPLAPARADGLPAAPAGFSWIEATNGAGTFLRPDGWFTREETHGDTQAFFITKTRIEDGGRFDVGFTVNAFDHLSRHGTTPSAWARAMVARLAANRQVLKSGLVRGNTADMNVLRVVDTRGGPPVVIHYLTIGDDARDRGWLLIFEAPQPEWDADYPVAQAMLNAFGL